MNVRGTFTDIYGETHTGTATLGCDGQKHAVWSGGVSCTEVMFSPIKCNTQARAMCGRSSTGNLFAEVQEDACGMDDFEVDENDADAFKMAMQRRLLSTRRGGGSGRRLLNMRGSNRDAFVVQLQRGLRSAVIRQW